MKRFLDNSFVKFGIIAMMIIAFFALETHEYGFNWIILSISLIAMIINFLYVFYNKIFERMIDGFVKYRFLIFTIFLWGRYYKWQKFQESSWYIKGFYRLG